MSSTTKTHSPLTGRKKISTTPDRTVSTQKACPNPSAGTPWRPVALADTPTTVLPEEDWRVEEHWALVTAHAAQMYFPAEG